MTRTEKCEEDRVLSPANPAKARQERKATKFIFNYSLISLSPSRKSCRSQSLLDRNVYRHYISHMTHDTSDYMSYVNAAAKVMRDAIRRLKSDEESLREFKEKCKESSPGVAEFIEGILEREPLFCTEGDMKEYIDAVRSQDIKTQKQNVGQEVEEAIRRLKGGEGDRDRDVEKLKPESQKGNEETVMNAALTLGRIGDSSAIKPLIEVLKSEYPSVRAAVAWALGSIGEAAAIEPLELLSGTEKDRWVKDYLREALEKIRDRKADQNIRTSVGGRSENQNTRKR